MTSNHTPSKQPCLRLTGSKQYTDFLARFPNDIRFWIVLFFVLRLWGITNPPLEAGHNWRQTTVTMVARNFLETDNNLFYPRVDFAGEKSGITGMEFPLLNYLIYLVSAVFGYQHWFGRLINLLVSSLGLLFFYKLVRKYFPGKAAFYACIILAVSIWFQYSRKIMPDTFSVSLVIASLYYGSNYLDAKNSWKKTGYLAAYFVLFVLGTLSKLPAAFLLVLLVFFLLDKHILSSRKVMLSLVTLLGLLPVYAWYFYWVPYLVETYGFWHFFMGKSIAAGSREIIQNLPDTLAKFYDTALKFSGFAVFLLGLVYAVIRHDKKVLLVFLISLLAFSLVIVKAGYAFPHHSYYVIPFVPVMALMAGYGLSTLRNRRIVIAILVVVAVEGIANQQHDFRIRESERFLVKLESELDKVTARQDLFLINSGDFPTPMYFAHRKGWISNNEKIQDTSFIKILESNGLRYILILKRSFGTAVVPEGFQQIMDHEDYSLYRR